MRCFIGIDLGSTTTKAIIMDAQSKIIGRGITNSRSNYDVACNVAKTEAYIDARFGLLRQKCQGVKDREIILKKLENAFRLEQYLEQLCHFIDLFNNCLRDERYKNDYDQLIQFSKDFEFIARENGNKIYLGTDKKPRSDFFRDLIGFTYNPFAAKFSSQTFFSFDKLIGLFDKSIIQVENQALEFGFQTNIKNAFNRVFQGEDQKQWLEAIDQCCLESLEEICAVGTGYGRQRLPFPKEQIRSEILCHGLGAHYMFPDTKTLLDIGGQDTKAIQVDSKGIVTSFQMNDRCAAGCGRYLGYIAEEMNLSLPELGPLAMTAKKEVKINSTCTVFAGAELRDRLSDGQKREDILLGLHRAIIYRALGLLARSGGILNEFTFTGGVAKNEAAVKALRDLTHENYGKDVVINIGSDSIYTGAVGAALFAIREKSKPVEDKK